MAIMFPLHILYIKLSRTARFSSRRIPSLLLVVKDLMPLMSASVADNNWSEAMC